MWRDIIKIYDVVLIIKLITRWFSELSMKLIRWQYKSQDWHKQICFRKLTISISLASYMFVSEKNIVFFFFLKISSSLGIYAYDMHMGEEGVLL